MAEFVNGKRINDPTGDTNYHVNCTIEGVTEGYNVQEQGDKESRMPIEIEQGMTIKIEANTPRQQRQRDEVIAAKMGKSQEKEI